MQLTLHFIFLRNQHKHRLRIPNHNPLDPNTTHTRTPHNLQLRTMEVSTDKLTPMARRRDRMGITPFLQIQHLLHIPNPHRIQLLENFIPDLLLRQVVNARDPFLPRGQRLRFLLAEEVLLFSETLETASCAVVCRCRGGRPDVEGFLLDAFSEELLGGIGGVGAEEEFLGDVLLRRHCRSRTMGCLRGRTSGSRRGCPQKTSFVGRDGNQFLTSDERMLDSCFEHAQRFSVSFHEAKAHKIFGVDACRAGVSTVCCELAFLLTSDDPGFFAPRSWSQKRH